MKFQEGDYVIGNEKANEDYGITRQGFKGIVANVYTDANEEEVMDIEAFEDLNVPEKGTFIKTGHRFYNLRVEDFDPYKPTVLLTDLLKGVSV